MAVMVLGFAPRATVWLAQRGAEVADFFLGRDKTEQLQARVETVEGQAGDFEVTVTRKPRYVKEEICTGCTTCVEYCPVEIPDPFNQDLSGNKAVHIYFSQAVPLVPYIDDRCLYLEDKKCSICVGVCKTDAIDLHQQPEPMEVEA